MNPRTQIFNFQSQFCILDKNVSCWLWQIWIYLWHWAVRFFSSIFVCILCFACVFLLCLLLMATADELNSIEIWVWSMDQPNKRPNKKKATAQFPTKRIIIFNMNTASPAQYTHTKKPISTLVPYIRLVRFSFLQHLLAHFVHKIVCVGCRVCVSTCFLPMPRLILSLFFNSFLQFVRLNICLFGVSFALFDLLFRKYRNNSANKML